MKLTIGSFLIATTLASCGTNTSNEESRVATTQITGTWKLLTGTIIEKGDTVVTDYTKNRSFIKIINESHFAFLHHDLNKGKDSAAVFVAGGGSYSLADNKYTEHLEYCTSREWEGNDFTFTISIKGDSLIQSGVEKVENAGIDRLNIEKYIRLKK